VPRARAKKLDPGHLEKLVEPFRIGDGKQFRLADIDPASTGGLGSKQRARAVLERGIVLLSEMQEKLYAQDRWSLLLIFQAMDAAGKDSTIKHVMSGINPQGCQVYSFKAPSPEELDHDYLWRTMRCLPERGRIGIFNRSYYEEVLVVRVHPELLARQKLPPSLVGDDLWAQRYRDINDLERYLARNGTAICKFFLHVSKQEQKKRFIDRLDEPEKHWKFSLNDVRERQHWSEYMRVYEEMIRHTATRHAPWYVVPADHKWFTRLVVASVIHGTLEELKLAYPAVGREKRREIKQAREELEGEE
jgi:PPK2 family polyphosphate:nucleotide phosphotransferase